MIIIDHIEGVSPHPLPGLMLTEDVLTLQPIILTWFFEARRQGLANGLFYTKAALIEAARTLFKPDPEIIEMLENTPPDAEAIASIERGPQATRERPVRRPLPEGVVMH